MNKLEFCQRLVYLDRKPISFSDRPYLPAIYQSRAKNLVLRCSRQTEKSTFLVNTILFEACTHPGIRMLLVCPRYEQVRVFCRSRLFPGIEQGPLIRRALFGRRPRLPPIGHMVFRNDSQLFARAAYHSGDACRGLSADLLMVDEFQDIAAGDLPVLQETLSHSRNGRTILTGTPKTIDNHLESMFRQSTANEWTVPCPGCRRGAILDENSFGPAGIICPSCRQSLDPRNGQWVPRNADATWGQGFWICHPMVPWINFDELLDRQRVYDLARFRNEVLGLPTTLGDHIVTRAELEGCCRNRPMTTGLHNLPPVGGGWLVAGIDWGGGGSARTVLVIGLMRSDYAFEVCLMERFPAAEDPETVLKAVARRCTEFQVRVIGADGGGNGHVYNRLLFDRLQRRPPLYAILYSAADQPPRQDGVLCKWTVNRSATIGVLFSRIKKQTLLFPRAAECASFLDEFEGEIAEYDDINRTIAYSHPQTQPDDALHATNYALLVGTRGFRAQS